jgi:hypothetical protein
LSQRAYDAIGTAAAVGATAPYYTGAGYSEGSPYYSGAVRAARAAYYGGYPSAAGIPGGSSPHYAVRAYYASGPWYGYSGWDDSAARNSIRCSPGSRVKLDDGQMYVCQ